jgi:hypothetical protein
MEYGKDGTHRGVKSLSLKISNKRNTWQGKSLEDHEIWPFHYFKDILNQLLEYQNIDFRSREVKSEIFLFSFSDGDFEGSQARLEKIREYQYGCYYEVSEARLGNIRGHGWLPGIISEYFGRKFPDTLYVRLERSPIKSIIN